MNPVLKVCGLTKAFGKKQVLDGVTFELPANSVSVLLGSNGAGKSTLMRCLLGLVKPNAGEIQLFGNSLHKHSRATRELVGFVPDEADACGWMSAPELFAFLRVQYSRWSDEKLADLSARLTLPLQTRIAEMSRGEAAKTMLAAALASRPRLLLLDEPFARLAPPIREEVLGVFLEEAPLEGGAVLLATHDLEVAGHAADRVLLLDKAKIAEDVEIEALLARNESNPRLKSELRALYPEPNTQEVA